MFLNASDSFPSSLPVIVFESVQIFSRVQEIRWSVISILDPYRFLLLFNHILTQLDQLLRIINIDCSQ